MSLVQFKITNHPQQVAKRGASDTVDERITPDWLFQQFDALHRFTVDVAANASNTKCAKFYDLESDGLSQSWAGERVWCNPPYSNIRGWVEKAWASCREGSCLVAMLLPANRTEQKWWQELVEPYRGTVACDVQFLPRRINFGVPGNEAAKFNSSPPFGLCLLTIRSQPV
jgi:phage N-6-adenine-methyltransferase